jgi:hypothetical protein
MFLSIEYAMRMDDQETESFQQLRNSIRALQRVQYAAVRFLFGKPFELNLLRTLAPFPLGAIQNQRAV